MGDDSNMKKKNELSCDDDKDSMIYRLISEKKELEEKNKRFASILEVVTKKMSTLNSNPTQALNDKVIDDLVNRISLKLSTQKSNTSNVLNDELIEDLVNQISLLKKRVSSIEHILEKANIESNFEQINKTLSKLSLGFETIENSLSRLDKVSVIENKLNDIEDLIRIHKRTGDNPFGMLGRIGKDSNSINIEAPISAMRNNVISQSAVSSTGLNLINKTVDNPSLNNSNLSGTNLDNSNLNNTNPNIITSNDTNSNKSNIDNNNTLDNSNVDLEKFKELDSMVDLLSQQIDLNLGHKDVVPSDRQGITNFSSKTISDLSNHMKFLAKKLYKS
ncbi:MAG: hypothetical protein K0B02_01470 [DPANN group archaeon]|nr:hypothetical protein [DPANN group archaeon]